MATLQPLYAKYPGKNGQVVFTQYDSAGSPHVMIANPDGTQEHELILPIPSDFSSWSPDGSKILVNSFPPDGIPQPAIVNPDGSDFTLLSVGGLPPDAGVICSVWSRDALQLLCQVGANDPSLNGIYIIRSSDGGGLTRLTVNPFPPIGNFGGGDVPCDYSPDGSQFVFMRAKPGAGPVPDRNQSGALFVENADGTRLHQITPYGLVNSHDLIPAHWSPDGSEIVFASAQGSLFVIHPNGTAARQIPLSMAGSYTFAFSPDWSPDGTGVVFSMFSKKAGEVDIYTARADGSQLNQLTNTSDFKDLPNWGSHGLQ
jgi:Tol biopolymer transport system component